MSVCADKAIKRSVGESHGHTVADCQQSISLWRSNAAVVSVSVDPLCLL